MCEALLCSLSVGLCACDESFANRKLGKTDTISHSIHSDLDNPEATKLGYIEMSELDGGNRKAQKSHNQRRPF